MKIVPNGRTSAPQLLVRRLKQPYLLATPGKVYVVSYQTIKLQIEKSFRKSHSILKMWHNRVPPEAPPNIIGQVQEGVHLLAPAAGPKLPPTRLVVPARRLGLVGP